MVLVFHLGEEPIAQVGLQADPAQWIMPNANYAGWNYSRLDQIDLDNVESLSMVWTQQLGIQDSHEASPLVIGDTMYIVTPKPNYVYALDLTRQGVIKWEFRPEISDEERMLKSACCGAQTGGLAYDNGRIFFSTLFYYGTSNCGPWNPDYRREWGVVDLDEHGGLQSYQNNYCSSILARDADSGELVWSYNLTPQDHWDLDEPNANILVDLEIEGTMHKALVRPARNGLFYVFDRATGEISSSPGNSSTTTSSRGRHGDGEGPVRHRKMMFADVEDRQKYLHRAGWSAVCGHHRQPVAERHGGDARCRG